MHRKKNFLLRGSLQVTSQVKCNSCDLPRHVKKALKVFRMCFSRLRRRLHWLNLNFGFSADSKSIFMMFSALCSLMLFGSGSSLLTAQSTPPSTPYRRAAIHSERRDTTLNSRRAFVASIVSTVTTSAAAGVAFAANDPSKVGTKDDPDFQACLSKCIFFCTKPKGSETMPRSQCLPVCKKQCATTKAQAMTGVPK